MKKYIAIVLISVIMVAITACGKIDDDLSQIYEIGSGSLGANTDDIQHANVITSPVDSIQEDLVGKTMTFSTKTKTYSLTYNVTTFYPHRDLKVHEYKIDVSDDGFIQFREDGSLFTIVDNQICLLGIDKNDTSDTVRMLLEPAISDLIDLSKYEKVEVLPRPSSDGFGSYIFCYYNTIQGYWSDTSTIFVSDDGRVSLIMNEDIHLDASAINTISKEREKELLQKKIQNMCDTAAIQYISHEILDGNSTPRFTLFNGEVCILYNFDCNAYNEEKEENASFSSKLLIPVRLLTED